MFASDLDQVSSFVFDCYILWYVDFQFSERLAQDRIQKEKQNWLHLL